MVPKPATKETGWLTIDDSNMKCKQNKAATTNQYNLHANDYEVKLTAIFEQNCIDVVNTDSNYSTSNKCA